MRVDAIVYKNTENGVSFGRVTEYDENSLTFKTANGELITCLKSEGDAHRVGSISEMVRSLKPKLPYHVGQLVTFNGALGSITDVDSQYASGYMINGSFFNVTVDDPNLVAVEDENSLLPAPVNPVKTHSDYEDDASELDDEDDDTGYDEDDDDDEEDEESTHSDDDDEDE